MGSLTSISHTIYAITSVNTKRKRKTRGATMLTKVTKAHEIGVRFPVSFCLIYGKAYGEYDDNLRCYVAVQGRSKVNILIDNWNDIDNDF